MGIHIQNLCGLVHNTGQKLRFLCQEVVALHRDTCYLAPSSRILHCLRCLGDTKVLLLVVSFMKATFLFCLFFRAITIQCFLTGIILQSN